MRLALFVALVAGCDGASPRAEHLDAAPAIDATTSTDAGPELDARRPPPMRDAAGARDGDAADARAADVGAAESPLVVSWAPCGLVGMMGTPGECADVDVPLRWENPDSRRIPIRVTRYRQVAGSRGQLWILIGGPGVSSIYLEQGLPTFASWLATDLDIYMLDYRGVGRGTRLGCPDAEDVASTDGADIAPSEWPACAESLRAEWGDDLSAFSTTETARDLGHLVTATRRDGEQVFVYGISYGSYLGQRYLAEFPRQADGVVLEALLPPQNGLLPIVYERAHDRVGHEILDTCGADAECASHLGPDPWSVLGRVLADLDGGHCPELAADGLDSGRLRRALGLLVQLHQLRRLIPAVIHRVARCSAADVAAMRVFLTYVPDTAAPRGPPDELSALNSDVLKYLLSQNELYQRPPPSREEVAAAESEIRFAVGIARDLEPSAVLRFDEPPDEPWADTTIPILFIQGEWDTQTPRENAAIFTDHLEGRLVIIPHAPHEASVYSPVVGGGPPCGARIMRQFLGDPHAELDVSCLDDLVPFDFSDLRGLSFSLFGTFDAWGDDSM